MGAHFVHGFGIDQDALAVFQTNLEDFEMDNVDLVNIDVTDLGPDWKQRVDTVVMNPPFGTKHNKGLDMKFYRLAWKWPPELCIHSTKVQPEIMSCPRQRSGGQ